MKNLEIRGYSAVAVVHSPDKDSFLFNFYDDGYPRQLYRGRANLIGGNRESNDRSSLETIRREISEEFSVAVVSDDNRAPTEQVSLIRNYLLNNLKPYKDFIVTVPQREGGAKQDITLLTSTYSVELPSEVFEMIKNNGNRRFVTEGKIGVEPMKRLRSGEVLFAWDSGVELADFLSIAVPNPEGVIIHTTLTPIRGKYADYVNGKYGQVNICFK